MFFAMSYAFVRGYRDQPMIAGLRLTIIPIALGIVAPFAGSIPDRYARLVLVSGPALCCLSALALMQALSGAPDSLPMVMIALAIYGVGMGIYIASNNNETMAAAPVEKSATAGGLINLLRIFGGGVGVAVIRSPVGVASRARDRNPRSDEPSDALDAALGG